MTWNCSFYMEKTMTIILYGPNSNLIAILQKINTKHIFILLNIQAPGKIPCYNLISLIWE